MRCDVAYLGPADSAVPDMTKSRFAGPPRATRRVYSPNPPIQFAHIEDLMTPKYLQAACIPPKAYAVFVGTSCNLFTSIES
jgi:hypothetical protein